MLKDRLIKLLEVFFPVVIAFKLIEAIRTGYYKESWQITEWLINYQGGFVRRGLPGELLLRSYYRWGVDPYYAILAVCLILYLGVVVFFYRGFRRAGLPLFLLPFVFFLGGAAVNNNWVRKDVCLLVLFIGSVRLAVKGGWGRAVGMNLLLVVALLVHESIGFWGLPVLLLLLRRSQSPRGAGIIRRTLTAVLQLSPALATFLLVLQHKGSREIATAIWESWRPIRFPLQNFHDKTAIPAAIDGISWSLGKGLGFTGEALSSFTDGISAPLAWLVIVASVFVVTVNIHHFKGGGGDEEFSDDEGRSLLCSTMLLQFLAVSPLFILGIDYGRWIFFWITTSFALYLLVPHATLHTLIPRYLAGLASKVLSSLDSIFCRPKSELFLILLFLGTPNSVWSVANYYRTTPLYLMLEFASKAVRSVGYYLGYH